MADYGTKATDKAIKKLDKEIQSVYEEAERDIQAKMDDFVKKFKPKWDIQKKKLDNGEITQEQYDNWYKGQVFQRNQWKAKKQEIQQVLSHSNQVAVKMINAESIHVFSTNANYASYTIDKAGSVDFNFQLYDSSAVTNLIKNNPQVLPKWKIDEPKDYVWNGKKVNRQVTQGIIQGESLDQIAKRLATNLSTQNYNHMRTFARTAMTGAQNAGREQSLKNARDMGLKVVKQWMATLDGRTRDSHAMMDGETIKVGDKWHHYKFSNGLRYPGDPEGPAREVYNCRCTLVGDLEDYPSEYERYDNIDGKPVSQMTYSDWYKAKYGQQHPNTTRPSSTAGVSQAGLKNTKDWIDRCKNNPDVNEMLRIEQSTFGRYTPEQVRALKVYTGSSYEEMNNYLRLVGAGVSHSEAVGRVGINGSQLDAIKLCHDALTTQALDRDMVLRRGTDVGDLAGLFMQGNFEDNKNSLQGKSAGELNSMFQGQVGKYLGFTSTSSQWDRGFDDEVEILFHAPKGTPAASIMNISVFGTGEGETLLRDDTTVVCDRIEKSDGHKESKIRVFLRIVV